MIFSPLVDLFVWIKYNGCVIEGYPYKIFGKIAAESSAERICHYYVYCDYDVEVSDYDPRYVVVRWKMFFKHLDPEVKVDADNIVFWRHGDITVDRYPTDKNVSRAIIKIIREKISARFPVSGERVVLIRNSDINKNPSHIDPTVWRV